MDKTIFTTSSADEADHSEDCKKGQKIHLKITTRQDTLPILSLMLMVFVLLAFVTFPPHAISSSCGMECCCKNCNAHKGCMDDCKSDSGERDSDKGKPRQGQQYEDIKCFNVCMESGYTCKHCEDACSYRKK